MKKLATVVTTTTATLTPHQRILTDAQATSIPTVAMIGTV